VILFSLVAVQPSFPNSSSPLLFQLNSHLSSLHSSYFSPLPPTLISPPLSSQPTKTHHVSCQTQNACRQYLIQQAFRSILPTDPSINKLILLTCWYLKPFVVSG
jgi:hypothetical protein